MLAQLTKDVGSLVHRADRAFSSLQSGLKLADSKVGTTAQKVVSQEKIIAMLHDLPIQALGGLLQEIAGYRSDKDERAAIDTCGRYLSRFQPPVPTPP